MREAIPRFVHVHLVGLVLRLRSAPDVVHPVQPGAPAHLTRRAVVDLRADERVQLVLRAKALAILPREMKRLGHDAGRRVRFLAEAAPRILDPTVVAGAEDPFEHRLVGDELTCGLIGGWLCNRHGVGIPWSAW